MRKKILLVEDDTSLGFLITELLEDEDFEVKLCRDGLTGWKSFQQHTYDLCILDVSMPGMDGFQLAEKIHNANPRIPFLFLTARTLKEDKLRGFALGAQDYILKPFDQDELICRMRVMLQRNGKVEVATELENPMYLGDYLFDHARQELSWNEELWRLTEKENAVLKLLCQNKNQILKREEAVEAIYGKKDYFLGRSFDVFISHLRKMLANDPQISIDNVFKVGFILNVRKQENAI
jgi:DNA-binding response OmpR family regulator